MTKITLYLGFRMCCDCGRIGCYTVNKDGYQFTVCSDYVHNYKETEGETNENNN